MILTRFYSNYIQSCSSSYKNLSKLSLKVYYLQEISKLVSARNNTQPSNHNFDKTRNLYPVDHHTFNENDLRQLSHDISKSINDLSPSQLLATAISYNNLPNVSKNEWKRLCNAVLKQVYGNCYNINAVSPSHVSMILYSYAKRFTNQIPITYKLLKSAIKSTGSLNERDISMILYYMRRTKCVPRSLNNTDHLKNAQILRAVALCLSKEGGNKMVKFTPSGLVSVVYNFTQIGMIPWSLMYHACNLIKKRAHKLDSKSIGFHSRSLTLLNIRDKVTIETFISSLNKHKNVPVPTISSLIYSLARLKYRPRGDLVYLLDLVRRSIPLFDDRNMAITVYSLGQLGIKSEEIFESVSMLLKDRIDYQSAQHLSMFIRGYSKLGIYDLSIIELIVEHSLKLLTGFSLPQIVCMMDSLVVLGYFNESAFTSFLNYFCSFSSDELTDYLVNQVNRIVYSIKLEQPEYALKAPNYIRPLFDQYQGQFIIKDDSKGNNESLYRTLKEMGINYRTSEKIGSYTPDAILYNNVSLEILSKGSICPVTNSVLGSSKMIKRHMKLLGYNHIQINKNEW
ncbi:hypothetical protein MACK_001529 [Theileria orientalis]|uniref:RAP domain-containing protein n=1 Tax=Theileria orientalis TaxID=68886 RepID=A0A976MD43_THEOR|nr:hypothetical protein MACK_001529 [Theileria orientalis]